jgi:hypothetical protein
VSTHSVCARTRTIAAVALERQQSVSQSTVGPTSPCRQPIVCGPPVRPSACQCSAVVGHSCDRLSASIGPQACVRECARSSSFADILVGVNAEIDEAETAEAHVVRPNLILDGSILNTHCAKPTAASRRPQADGRKPTAASRRPQADGRKPTAAAVCFTSLCDASVC